MSEWVNTGDISPKSGTVFMRDPKISGSGDFEAEAIETISETTVGGDEKRVMIRQGTVFLSKERFDAALASTDARTEGGKVVRSGHNGEDVSADIGSEEGLLEMFRAAHGYGGLDDVTLDRLVQIGEDDEMDLERRFSGDIVVYPEGSSIWSIISNEASGFDYPHGKPPATAIETVRDVDTGPGF